MVVVPRGEGRSGGKVLSKVRNLIVFIARGAAADGEGEIKCLSEWMINGPTLEPRSLGGNFLKGGTGVRESPGPCE